MSRKLSHWHPVTVSCRLVLVEVVSDAEERSSDLQLWTWLQKAPSPVQYAKQSAVWVSQDCQVLVLTRRIILTGQDCNYYSEILQVVPRPSGYHAVLCWFIVNSFRSENGFFSTIYTCTKKHIKGVWKLSFNPLEFILTKPTYSKHVHTKLYISGFILTGKYRKSPLHKDPDYFPALSNLANRPVATETSAT